MKPVCSFAGCGKPAAAKNPQLCATHYRQFTRHGRDMSKLKPLKLRTEQQPQQPGGRRQPAALEIPERFMTCVAEG